MPRLTSLLALPLLVGGLLQPALRERPLLHHQHRPRRLARAAFASEAAAVPPSTFPVDPQSDDAYTRPAYLLTDKPRPVWRGRMMGFMHNTRLWYVLAVSYVGLAIKLSPTPMAPLDLLLRVLAAVATCANIFISDGYHNPDTRGTRRGNEALDTEVEKFWLRWDYVGISGILATQYWLWAANFGWLRQLELGGWLSGLSLAGVMAISRTVVPKKIGHTSVKLIMGFQFGALLLYLVYMGFVTLPLCRKSMLIFAAYTPGLICYAIKKPSHPVFGFHEIFHTSVLVGHLASMGFDLFNIAFPCAC